MRSVGSSLSTCQLEKAKTETSGGNSWSHWWITATKGHRSGAASPETSCQVYQRRSMESPFVSIDRRQKGSLLLNPLKWIRLRHSTFESLSQKSPVRKAAAVKSKVHVWHDGGYVLVAHRPALRFNSFTYRLLMTVAVATSPIQATGFGVRRKKHTGS